LEGTGSVWTVLGLPDGVTACLFDLDGVLTQTAKVHAAAWKEMFDDYLRGRAAEQGEEFVPFDPVRDYDEYVDGKPRYEGVRSFLDSRGIELPQGTPDDPPDAQTIDGLGNRKNELVLAMIRERGVEPYEGSVRYVRAAREAGLRRAVVSSSTNCHDVLVAAGIDDLFEEVVDGVVAEREHLRGKPAPDTFLAGARALGIESAAGCVFEDALAGVEAGRAGNFGRVVGVDRVGQADALRAHGADVVVRDLAELLDGP
jgi:beta-phosphoglucomutase family hydrolase